MPGTRPGMTRLDRTQKERAALRRPFFISKQRSLLLLVRLLRGRLLRSHLLAAALLAGALADDGRAVVTGVAGVRVGEALSAAHAADRSRLGHAPRAGFRRRLLLALGIARAGRAEHEQHRSRSRQRNKTEFLERHGIPPTILRVTEFSRISRKRTAA